MKSPIFYAAAISFVFLLVLAAREADGLSPGGRRFGRSVCKKYRKERSRQAHFYHRRTNSMIESGNKVSQRVHDTYLVSEGRIRKQTKQDKKDFIAHRPVSSVGRAPRGRSGVQAKGRDQHLGS